MRVIKFFNIRNNFMNILYFRKDRAKMIL